MSSSGRYEEQNTRAAMLRVVCAIFSEMSTKQQLDSETIRVTPRMHQRLSVTLSPLAKGLSYIPKITYPLRADKEARSHGRTHRLGIR